MGPIFSHAKDGYLVVSQLYEIVGIYNLWCVLQRTLQNQIVPALDCTVCTYQIENV